MPGSVKPNGRPALLRVEDVAKTFPNGTVALAGVDLTVHAGAVHGLVGANGAGKSTLIKILAGAHPATRGRVVWRGRETRWTTPGQAREAGLATIYQHVPLALTLSVIENVFLARRGPWRRPRAMRREFDALLERVGYSVDPDVEVARLSLGQRQMVSILQALAAGADLVVMDEPTASLAQGERTLVFDVVRRLREEGTAFLYVSHFLDEVLELTDWVTVLRDGRVVADRATEEFDENGLTQAIVGKELLAVERAGTTGAPTGGAPLLEVRDLASPGRLHGISFDLAPGEVLGLAGLLGSGRSEILHALFGADPHATGTVRLDGEPVGRSTPAAVAAGLALVPEDRARQGLLTEAEIWRNTSLPDLPVLSARRLVPLREPELQRARAAIEALSIRAPGPEAIVRDLSGGNAQKVVFGKWLFGAARVFLLDEPTAGIDVGAKADILDLIRRFAREGRGVVLVSSELEELLAVCRRVLVVHRGRVVAERPAEETSEHELLRLASGFHEEQMSHG